MRCLDAQIERSRRCRAARYRAKMFQKTTSGHTEKLYLVRFHPLARDVLATASYDMTVRVWDVGEADEWLQLAGHTDTVRDAPTWWCALFTKDETRQVNAWQKDAMLTTCGRIQLCVICEVY